MLEGLRELKLKGPSHLANGLLEWEEDNSLVYHQGRVYIPPDEELHKEVVRQCHDDPTAGHPGLHGTLDLVNTHFWWPTMWSFVEKYVDRCDTCAWKKLHQHPCAVTQLLDVPGGPWEEVGVDLITQLPESHGYDAIFVAPTSSQSKSIPFPAKVTSQPMALQTSIIRRSSTSMDCRYALFQIGDHSSTPN